MTKTINQVHGKVITNTNASFKKKKKDRKILVKS